LVRPTDHQPECGQQRPCSGAILYKKENDDPNMKTRIAWLIALAAIAGFVALHPPRPALPVSASPAADLTAPAGSAIISRRAGLATTSDAQTTALWASRTAAASGETSLRLAREIERGLSSTNDADHDLVFTNLLPALIALDPARAGRLAENLEPGPMREELLRRVSHLWSGVDSTAAADWAANLKDDGDRVSALTDVCIQVAQANPALALEMAARYDLGGNGTLENLAQLWAGQDLPSALDWARGQPAGEPRDQMVARVAFVQAQTDPVEAAKLIVNQMTPGEAQNEAALSVLHQWALRDPATAAAWADRFPESPLRQRAFQELSGIAAYQNQLNPP
jgi:hypothetical protein